MWYFIVGNLMSWFTFFILTKSTSYFNYLLLNESFLGWFLIEHIFEEYCLTANKFFLINYDFRDLLKNFFMLIKNILLTAQPFNVIDIFLLNLCVILKLLFFNKPNFYYNFGLLIFFVFYFFKCYFFFGLFDIFTCCKYLVLVFSIFTVLIYYLTILCGFFMFINYKYFNKTVGIKILSFLLILCTIFVLVILYFYLFMDIQNNIIHENMLIIILPYYYLYAQILFKLFELKCLQSINYVKIYEYQN